MLRARRSDGTVILGLDAENFRRMQAGQHVLVNLEQLGGAHSVILMYGNTLDDIRIELEALTGPLPPATPLPRGH